MAHDPKLVEAVAVWLVKPKLTTKTPEQHAEDLLDLIDASGIAVVMPRDIRSSRGAMKAFVGWDYTGAEKFWHLLCCLVLNERDPQNCTHNWSRNTALTERCTICGGWRDAERRGDAGDHLTAKEIDALRYWLNDEAPTGEACHPATVRLFERALDQLAAAKARVAELEAERIELYEFLDLLNTAGLRFNDDVPLKEALQIIRKIGGSKHVWPVRDAAERQGDAG